MNEKRKLNEYKPLFSEHGVNYTYGRDFDLYLNDHFLGRNSLSQTKNYLFSLINRRFENDFIIAGKERFYFERKNIQEIISWNGKDFSALERNLSRLKSFCDANKIDLYFCVVPFKGRAYFLEIYDKILKIKGISMKEAIKKTEVLIEALPYIQKFKNRMVIKYGGSTMAEEGVDEGILKDIAFLRAVGICPVVVHGGGKHISRRTKEGQNSKN